jgi:hypothetical protein
VTEQPRSGGIRQRASPPRVRKKFFCQKRWAPAAPHGKALNNFRRRNVIILSRMAKFVAMCCAWCPGLTKQDASRRPCRFKQTSPMIMSSRKTFIGCLGPLVSSFVLYLYTFRYRAPRVVPLLFRDRQQVRVRTKTIAYSPPSDMRADTSADCVVIGLWSAWFYNGYDGTSEDRYRFGRPPRWHSCFVAITFRELSK